jgi:formamidase
MRSRVHLRFGVRKGEAERQVVRDLQFFRDDYFTRPEMAVPRRFYATTGISVRKDGQNETEDLTLAARNALLNMIEHWKPAASTASRRMRSAARRWTFASARR